MTIESTPSVPKQISIREEVEPYSSTGKVFRAYEGDLSLYMGAETREALVLKIRDLFPNATIVA